MKTIFKYFAVSIILLAASQVQAQEVSPVVRLDGPRFGFTTLPTPVANYVRSEFGKQEKDESMTISQFGWQFEEQVVQFSNGGAMVFETIILVGGMERNMFIPSGSFLIGTRSAGGFEFGVGPNLTPAGIGYAVAFGVTSMTENTNVPVNLALVSSEGGVRISILVGFNMKSR